MQEGNLSKENAYILFFVRKDVHNQSISQIYPKLQESYFPGKPIVTKMQENAFVLQTLNQTQIQAQIVKT